MTLILVTGSRTWSNRDAIAEEFDRLQDEVASSESGVGIREFSVMHGDCPLRQLPDGSLASADALAGAEARARGWDELRRPATWTDKGGKFDWRAGFVRNSAMVKEAAAFVKKGGLVVVLGFVEPCVKGSCWKPKPHGSHGAEHCIEEAVKADLPVRIVRSDT